MRKRILITGGTGLLGHALNKVCPDGIFLSSKDGDLRSPAETESVFKKHKPDAVIHLAAKVGGVKTNALRNADFFKDNVLINTNVLAAAQRHKVSRMVSVLSSCAFPFYDDRPTTEKDLHCGMPYAGNLGYGSAKRMLDIQTRLLWGQYGSCFTTVTPVTMYGPHDNWDLDDSHVLSALVHKCFHAARDKKPLEVWGSGNAVRQFVYASDVAVILLKILDNIEGPGTTVIAPGEGIRIKDLAVAIAKVMGFNGPVVFDKTKPEGQTVKRIESETFAKRFPGFRFTKLEQGLRETVEWFRKNHHLICKKEK